MANTDLISLERLAQYDGLIKNYIDTVCVKTSELESLIQSYITTNYPAAETEGF